LVCKLGSFGDEKIMKNKLKVYRAIHDLTQEELANKLGVTRATINAIERERYDPSLRLAFKIARFFEVTIETIFIEEN
jgi:putative transcriptional regulator